MTLKPEGLHGARLAKRVTYAQIPAYLAAGWIAYEPQAFDYQHLYGIIMYWICDCAAPFPLKEPSHDNPTTQPVRQSDL